MALSRLAREFAAEIANHDWSDAPFRTDRAGHQYDSTAAQSLTPEETEAVRTNVMWVVAQVLGHADPNFDANAYEFALACGCDPARLSREANSHGVRRAEDGHYCRPGTSDLPLP